MKKYEPPYRHPSHPGNGTKNLNTPDGSRNNSKDEKPSGGALPDSYSEIIVNLIKPHITIISALQNQAKRACAGYNDYVRDLGDAEISDEDFIKALNIKLMEWAADGSLAALEEWRKWNPGRQFYLAASPNRPLTSQELFSIANKLGGGQVQSYIQKYPIHYRYTKTTADINRETLPVTLTVWTDIPSALLEGLSRNMPGILMRNDQMVVGLHWPSGDQLPGQRIGLWYRLRGSGEFPHASHLINDVICKTAVASALEGQTDEQPEHK